MSSNVLHEGSIVLRLEFSIADAVRHRGLGAVIADALRAWWAQRPIGYQHVPSYLREDVGLPAEENLWRGVDLHQFRLPPPDRSWP